MAKTRSQSDASTKADRKFDKKLEFYSKVRDRVSTLNAHKTITKKKRLRSRQKNLKAYDFSSLSEVLPDLKTLDHKPALADIKLNCKSRRTIILKEASQLKTVLNNPAFQSDPLAAIHMHLQTTQPVMEESSKKKDKARENDAKKKKKKGKKKSKSSAGPQAMDV